VATFSLDRNLHLSLVTFIKTSLVAAGYTGITYVKDFPKDELIVLESTGKIDEVVVPALSIVGQTFEDGERLGLGEDTMWTYGMFSVFIYGLTRGQEIDIRSTLRQYFNDSRPIVYDFSLVGYSIGATSATTLGTMEFSAINSRSVAVASANKALENGGLISFRAETTRSSVNA